MRTRLPLFLLSLAASASAPAATRNFGINSFDKIRVDGPFKVQVKTGVAPFAKASGSTEALDRVAIDVQGRTLVVHPNRSSWGGYPGKDPGPVEIHIGTHELTAAWLNGSGGLEIDKVRGLTLGLSAQGSGAVAIAKVEVDQLNVGLAGNASATVSGKAGKLTAVIRGISSLDAAALVTKNASIGAEGAATVKAN
ncbi:MAG TPA: DUF2807 domain-containing protein, partial [Sphingomicrobium sp.]|nr:DUF2807 domain-containing protein [Sphingomicrobium sp.]